MSDDLHPEMPWSANVGVTLPNGVNTTYNVWLTPLFWTSSGVILPPSDIFGRGYITRSWTSNAHDVWYSYYFSATDAEIAVSQRNSIIRGLTFRCLVSTNNG